MLWFIISIILLITGFILNLLTFIGTPLILVSNIILSYLNNYDDLSLLVIISFVILTIIVEIIDFFSGLIGIKLAGGSKTELKYGIAGMIIGTIAAVFTFQFYLILVFLIAGIIIGNIINSGKIEIKSILKSLLGIVTSKMMSYVFKITVSLTMSGVYVYQIVFYFRH